MNAPDLRKTQNKLLELIILHYDANELRNLAFKLGLDWDELSGDTKSDKVRELISYLRRHGRLETLIPQLHQDRPKVQWPAIFPSQQIPRATPFPTFPRTIDLVGHEQTIEDVEKKLLDGQICILHGTSGVGKTSIAINLAYRLRESFPDGILWADLKAAVHNDGTLNESAIRTTLGNFANAYGLDVRQIEGIDGRKEKVLSMLADKRTLIVLDDAHGSKDSRYLLPPTIGKCAVLITTRSRRLFDFQASVFPIAPFVEEDSLTLLRQLIGNERVSREEVGASKISRLLGGLPLALEVVGRDLANMPGMSLDEYAQSLIDERAESDYLTDGEDDKDDDGKSKSVFAGFENSFQRLKPALQQFFIRLAVFHGSDFSVESAAAVAELSTRRAHRQIGQLHALSLIEYGQNAYAEEKNVSNSQGRYHLHTLLQVFSWRKLIETRDLQAETVQRAAVYFADFAKKSRNDYRKLALEWKNIMPILRWAYEQKQWAILYKGITGLTWINLGVVGFLDAYGYWREAMEMLTWLLENPDLADNALQKAIILFKLGVFYFRRADQEEAESFWKKSLAILTELPQTEDVVLGRAFVCQFMAQLEAGREPSAAITWAEEGDTLLQTLDNNSVVQHERGYLLIRLATVLGKQGQREEALAAVEEGLSLLPDVPSAARISGHITSGTLYYISGNAERGIIHWQAALVDTKQLGDLRQQAALQRNLAIHERRRGQFISCIAYNQKGLAACRVIGDAAGEGHISSNLGFVYLLQREPDKALLCIERALEIAQKHKQNSLIVMAEVGMARWLIQKKRYEEALAKLEESYQLCLDIKKIDSLPEILRLQAEVALHTDNPITALTLLEQAQNKARENNSERGIVKCCGLPILRWHSSASFSLN